VLKIAGRDFRFFGNLDDFYFQQLPQFYADGPKLGWYATAHLSRDAVCFDVGANIGLTALTLAAHCPDGHVFAFEPSPTNFEHLRRNIDANGLHNVTAIQAAVGDRLDTVQFNVASVGSNCTVARSDTNYDPARLVPVDLITLDDWISRQRMSRLDLIKVDVEGYEENVLAGAAAVLADRRPNVFMEFNSVTIAFEARESPLAFAERIWNLFDVSDVGSAGELTPAGGGELHRFVLDNMVHHRCVDDVVLRLKAGVTAETLRAALGHGDPWRAVAA
jgi:FkbM family methyltransferase